MISLSDLLASVTEDAATTTLIEYLDALGFAATSWQAGSYQRHLVQLGGKIIADMSNSVADITRGGFMGLAQGAWATFTAKQIYDTDRQDGIEAVGKFVLANAAGAPTHIITAGQLQFADAPTAPANTYRNTTGGTLNPGSTLTLDVEAETAGADANIPNSSTLYLWTPLVGVTVTNPAIGATGTWLTTVGVDEESDARLAQRALGKWSTRTYSAGDGAYATWVLEADETVTRVKVRDNNPGGAGTVEVLCATATAGITGSQITAIENYINGVTDGVGRRPLNDDLSVASAVVANQVITLTVKVDSDYSSTVDATTIEAAINAYLGSLPIGGKIIAPATTGVIVFAELVAAVMAIEGVENVTFASPTTDVSLAYNQIATATYTTTVTYV